VSLNSFTAACADFLSQTTKPMASVKCSRYRSLRGFGAPMDSITTTYFFIECR
jgi:hypothetical protein